MKEEEQIETKTLKELRSLFKERGKKMFWTEKGCIDKIWNQQVYTTGDFNSYNILICSISLM